MRFFNSKKIAVFLIFILLFHISIFNVFGIQEVKAGFWNDNKDNIFTVVKGMIMLWILNLMRENIGGNSDDDIITSTIKSSLNMDNDSNYDIDRNEDNSNLINIHDEKEELINNGNVTEEEFEMLKLVNQVRQEQGINLLEIDIRLASSARKKAFDMINNNYFDHISPTFGTPFDMIKSDNIEYALAGENLAESGSVEDAFKSLMDSPEHKANILNSRYDRIGIGIIKKESGGLMIVQLFIDSLDPTI